MCRAGPRTDRQVWLLIRLRSTYNRCVPLPAKNARLLPSAPSPAGAEDPTGDEPSRARLDGLVINVELTLVSIIQGVALYFLADSTRQLIASHAVEYYVYALNALLIIFLFWSRAVIHTFTVIRWPLEFSHNFLYITCALFEAISFANLNQPVLWNALQTVFAGFVWLLFALDLRLVTARENESAGSKLATLFRAIRRDQLLNAFVLIPLFVGFDVVATASLWPDPSRGQGFSLHLYFGGLQTLALTGYLIYLARFFYRIGPWLTAAP